jgi:hypothetical protein
MRCTKNNFNTIQLFLGSLQKPEMYKGEILAGVFSILCFEKKSAMGLIHPALLLGYRCFFWYPYLLYHLLFVSSIICYSYHLLFPSSVILVICYSCHLLFFSSVILFICYSCHLLFLASVILVICYSHHLSPVICVIDDIWRDWQMTNWICDIVDMGVLRSVWTSWARLGV